MISHLRSNAVAYLALFIALGGTSYAATVLPAHSVGARQLQSNAVTTTKVKNHSLKAVDFAPGQIPKGATGLTGKTGETGPRGPSGSIVGAPAGGALTGSYPDPSLASGSVGASQLANGAVGASQLANGSVTAAKVAAGSLTLSDLAVWTFNSTEPAGSIAAGQCLGTDVSGTGVTVGAGDVLMGWIDDTDSGLTFNPLIVTHANVADIEFCNDSGSNETFPALNYTVIAVQP
jgi:hypothetical protein